MLQWTTSILVVEYLYIALSFCPEKIKHTVKVFLLWLYSVPKKYFNQKNSKKKRKSMKSKDSSITNRPVKWSCSHRKYKTRAHLVLDCYGKESSWCAKIIAKCGNSLGLSAKHGATNLLLMFCCLAIQTWNSWKARMEL